MPERKTPERKTTSSRDDKPQDAEQPKQAMSRRGFLLGTGTGVAGLAVGGVAGSQVFPKQIAKVEIPVAGFWIGRDITACTGCKLCQIACSKTKEGKLWPSAARVSLHEYPPGVEFPTLCYQCADNAKCVDKCPAKALSIDTANNNVIKVDTSKCLRTASGGDCTVCADSCPGTAVTFHPVSKAPLICDLCNGDPACTKVCPKGALTNKGFKGAPASAEEIAARLQAMYVPPALPAPQAMGDSDQVAGTIDPSWLA